MYLVAAMPGAPDPVVRPGGRRPSRRGRRLEAIVRITDCAGARQGSVGPLPLPLSSPHTRARLAGGRQSCSTRPGRRASCYAAAPLGAIPGHRPPPWREIYGIRHLLDSGRPGRRRLRRTCLASAASRYSHADTQGGAETNSNRK